MKATQFTESMNSVASEIVRQIQELAFHIDADQYVEAGVAIGRLDQLGRRLSELAYFASQSASTDLWAARQTDKLPTPCESPQTKAEEAKP